MIYLTSRVALIGAVVALISACGGGSSAPSAATAAIPPVQTGSVAMIVSDASAEDWATIGVKVLSIALVPQTGGSNVTVYTAPVVAPVINLAQLDQLGELLGNSIVPAGSYTGAIVSIGGNSGDVQLIVAANPEAGFAAAAGSTIPANQIQIQHTQGTTPNLTVPVSINFDSPLVVSATQNNQLDVEFDLGHPAFIMGHTPPGSATLWAVNFSGPVHRHLLRDISRLVLRHMYGVVGSIATDNTSITINKEFPTVPVVNPETAVASTQTLQILADASNGTLFYDLDAKKNSVIKDFSSFASLVGKNVRVATRYQQNGTLVATRIWLSSQFYNVWLSPEGHVLHTDPIHSIITVANESGQAVALTVDSNTQFYFRQPQNSLADATPIGTGPSFLTNHSLVRGFKVHTSVVDPLATPLVAQSIDIETATYAGGILATNTTGFTYSANFANVADNYVYTLNYINSTTANGTDGTGSPILGYKWWNFAYPTLLMNGSNSISAFISATAGSVNFGGTVGALTARGVSNVIWNDPANLNGWSVNATALTPSTLPLGLVATGLNNNAFTMTIAGGTSAASILVSSTVGAATLVFQVDRNNGVVTTSPVDITTSTGLSILANGLAIGAPVKIYGIPQADATLKSYVLIYFTGDLPTQ